MASFCQLNALEAGTNIGSSGLEPKVDNSNAGPCRRADQPNYTFPAPSSSWDGPDDTYSPFSWWIVDQLSRLFPLQLQRPKTRHVPTTCDNMESFLAHEALHVYSEDTPSSDACGFGALAFGRLHHLNLHGFEEELSHELVSLHDSKTTSRHQILRLRKTMRDYCQAVRDFEFISTRAFRPPHRRPLYPYHESLLPSLNNIIKNDPLVAYDNLYHGISTAYATWSQTFVNRIWGAFFGGLALILPMIIMTVHNTVQKSLIVSSISVLIVAMVVARFSEGSWKEVLGLTASYAAVLVVFVGTTSAASL